MGYYQDLLNKLNIVESQGFNPYIESYSSRISQVTIPTVDNPTEPEYASVSEYTKAGFDNPFKTLYTDTGEINKSTISTPYNQMIQDPTLGDPNKYIQEVNTQLKPEQQIFINEDQSLRFGRQNAEPKYRFERTPSQTKGKEDVYIRWNENDGSYITYATKQAYEDALEKYKQTTGNDISTKK